MPRYASIYHIDGYGSTSISSSYSITPNVTSMNEGDSVIFTITTTGIANSTLLYWTTEGTVATNRFSTNTNNGSIIINNNAGTLTRTLINNLNIDGTTSFRILLRTTSVTGPTVATSNYVTVNDTSIISEIIFDGPGTYNWTVPTGITSISAVAVGGGGGSGSGFLTADVSGAGGGMGGGGGALAYTNNISVTPGEVMTVQVGAGGTKTITGKGITAVDGTDGGASFITYNGTVVVHAGGGQGGNGVGYYITVANKKGAGGTVIVGAGGAGGQGGVGAYDNVIRGASQYNMSGGGGGAGGYSGTGGAGGNANSNPNTNSFAQSSGGAGSGGGGGGGRSGWSYLNTLAYGASTVAVESASGGGVGIFGQGSNGAGGYCSGPTPNNAAYTAGGGSGGAGGTLGVSFGVAGKGSPTKFTLMGAAGSGAYGAGGGGSLDSSKYPAAKGGDGAVRIIWPTASYPSRAFPSTNAGQV